MIRVLNPVDNTNRGVCVTDPKDIRIVRSVAHDIRQMLMVITGRAGLLLEQDPDPRLRQHLLAMELAATDAGAMLNRLPGMGAGIPDENSAEVLQVVQDSCRLILPPDQKRWTVEFQIPAELDACLPAQILREVINNLLTNALEAMPDGGSVVLSGAIADDHIQLGVQDSGPGVPSDLAARIFESGFTTSGQEDRGVGLAGCRALLRRFGGDLTLNPSESGGATFLVDLPANLQAQAQAKTKTMAETEIMEPGEILVVDDELAVQEMLADVLTELGWKPSVAGEAMGARELFRPGRFPVALVDQSLPGMSGLELASELRAQDQRIVLVLVTGWGNEDIMSRASESGIDITAEKPLAVGKIRSILGQAAALSRERAEEREES